MANRLMLVQEVIAVEKKKMEMEKKGHERHHAHRPKEGDRVMVRLTSGVVEGKLQPRFAGPYIITRVNRAGNAILRPLKGGKELRRAINMARLKKAAAEPIEETGLIDDPEDAELFDIEYIVRDRVTKKGLGVEYLVHWANYVEKDRTWESEDTFVDLGPIERYWMDRGRRVEGEEAGPAD
jgi:hypothetical protein